MRKLLMFLWPWILLPSLAFANVTVTGCCRQGARIVEIPSTLEFPALHPGEADTLAFTLFNSGDESGTGTVALADYCPQVTILQGAGQYTLAPAEERLVVLRCAFKADGSDCLPVLECVVLTGAQP